MHYGSTRIVQITIVTELVKLDWHIPNGNEKRSISDRILLLGRRGRLRDCTTTILLHRKPRSKRDTEVV
jgi:hypothetical protein